MDAAQFDSLARRLGRSLSRRCAALALGGLTVAPLVRREYAEAGKKKKPVCLNGQTIKASSKKRKKLLKKGATPGTCRNTCSPQCNGTTCGDDGCGGTCGCGAGSVCNEGTCTACTVKCTGTPLGCGSQLKQALLDGGQIVPCPGQYAGNFRIEKNTTLIGAGSGSDPAANTILDAQGVGPVLGAISDEIVSLRGVRVVGGNGGQGGGMVIGDKDDVRISGCAFVGNKAAGGGGIMSFGALRVTNTLFDRNQATVTGGGIDYVDADRSFITDCTFTGNTAVSFGGGFYSGNTDVIVTGTEFSGNTGQRGGGLAMDGGTVSLDSATTIANNTAMQIGGGVARFNGTFNQNGATISGNNALSQLNCAGVTCT